MSLVTFHKDVYPYCRGDVVNLSKEDKKAVDAAIELKQIEDAYVSGSQPIETDDADPREGRAADQLPQDKVNAATAVEPTGAEVTEAQADAVLEGSEASQTAASTK